MARWTMPEAENAVKAAFFKELDHSAGDGNLRYKEIKGAISEGRPISDRTLSKALRGLQERNELLKGDAGRYELVVDWGRTDQMEIILAADKLSIDAGAAVGIIGDQRRGWTYYGVPLGKPRHLRPRLRRAAVEFQERIDEILRTEAELVVERTLEGARARGLPPPSAAEIQEILTGIFDYWEYLSMDQMDSFAFIQALEKLVPGVYPELVNRFLRPPIGIQNDMRAGIPVHRSMENRPEQWIPYLARISGEEERAIRDGWPRFLDEAEAGATALETLKEHLLAKDWKTFNSHWSSILAARYWLCAVIR